MRAPADIPVYMHVFILVSREGAHTCAIWAVICILNVRTLNEAQLNGKPTHLWQLYVVSIALGGKYENIQKRKYKKRCFTDWWRHRSDLGWTSSVCIKNYGTTNVLRCIPRISLSHYQNHLVNLKQLTGLFSNPTYWNRLLVHTVVVYCGWNIQFSFMCCSFDVTFITNQGVVVFIRSGSASRKKRRYRCVWKKKTKHHDMITIVNNLINDIVHKSNVQQVICYCHFCPFIIVCSKGNSCGWAVSLKGKLPLLYCTQLRYVTYCTCDICFRSGSPKNKHKDKSKQKKRWDAQRIWKTTISTVYVKKDVHMQNAVCCCFSVLFQYNLCSAHSETDSEQ